MPNIFGSIKSVKEKIEKNGGKPISSREVPDYASLLRRSYIKIGTSNEGSVVWLTDKAYNDLEDNEAE